MQVLRIIFLGLFLAACANVPSDLPPQLDGFVRPIRNAYGNLADDQAKLPPPRDVRDQLERLGGVDQVGRSAFEAVNLRTLTAEDARRVRDAIWRVIGTHDADDQRAFIALLPKAGWFTKSAYGAKASTAAFLIVQHATNNPALMRDVLSRMQPFVATGDVSGPAWAAMYDRIALEFDHKPQRYGTQIFCVHGQPWKLRDIEDPAHLDERRRSVGIKSTEAEYLAGLSGLCPR